MTSPCVVFCDSHAIKFLDLTDKIFKNKITLFILLCGKELLRCKKIYAAVDKDGIKKSHTSRIGFVCMVRRLPARPTQIMYGPLTCGIYNIPKRVRQVMITTFCWLLRLVRWELAEADSSSMQFHWSKITILVLLIPLVPGKLFCCIVKQIFGNTKIYRYVLD